MKHSYACVTCHAAQGDGGIINHAEGCRNKSVQPPDYKSAKGAIPWDGEPAEQSIRRLRDGDKPEMNETNMCVNCHAVQDAQGSIRHAYGCPNDPAIYVAPDNAFQSYGLLAEQVTELKAEIDRLKDDLEQSKYDLSDMRALYLEWRCKEKLQKVMRRKVQKKLAIKSYTTALRAYSEYTTERIAATAGCNPEAESPFDDDGPEGGDNG